jgi:chloramphenicol-sensitive protein RarD
LPNTDKVVRDGIVAGLIAYLLWGIMPIYFKIVGSVDPFEVFSHRIIWAIPFGAVVIGFRHQWQEIRNAFLNPKTVGWLAVSALLIGVNWLIYIFAIQDDRIFETSLGYYINPLLNMVFGVVLFGERLRRLQILAVASAFVGVLFLAIKGGQIPWVALALAFSFGTYGIIRKKVVISGMPGLFIETLLLAPFAIAWFAWINMSGQAAFGTGDTSLTLWLVVAGPLTALPLLFFALAARRLPLTMIGFMQFLSPSMHFVVGIYYGETLTTAHIICFTFIWLGVTFFIYDAAMSSKKKPLTENPSEA